MQPHSTCCVFLGFASQYKGYLCLEDVFPFLSDVIEGSLSSNQNEVFHLLPIPPNLIEPYTLEPSSSSTSFSPNSNPLKSPLMLPHNTSPIVDTPTTFSSSQSPSPQSPYSLPINPFSSHMEPFSCITYLEISIVIDITTPPFSSTGPTNTHFMVTKSKSNIVKPKHTAYVMYTLEPLDFEPYTYAQGSNYQAWIDSMADEYTTLRKNVIWDLVPLEDRMKVISN